MLAYRQYKANGTDPSHSWTAERQRERKAENLYIHPQQVKLSGSLAEFNHVQIFNVTIVRDCEITLECVARRTNEGENEARQKQSVTATECYDALNYVFTILFCSFRKIERTKTCHVVRLLFSCILHVILTLKERRRRKKTCKVCANIEKLLKFWSQNKRTTQREQSQKKKKTNAEWNSRKNFATIWHLI